MSDIGCEKARTVIPDFVGGRLDAPQRAELSAHLETCAECREEAELVSLLHATRPAPPAGLEARVKTALRVRRTVVRPWWGIAAAAVAAVALGIGVTNSGAPSDPEVPAFVASGATQTPWLSDDGLIAGAPALDELSEDALATLLEEMTVGGQA